MSVRERRAEIIRILMGRGRETLLSLIGKSDKHEAEVLRWLISAFGSLRSTGIKSKGE